METDKNYKDIHKVQASDIPAMIDACLASKINLLIYGTPGAGKSSIIKGMGDRYNIVALGAASMCEEMINGIPALNPETQVVTHSIPEWLLTILRNHEMEPSKPQILFIDELTLADGVVAQSLQMLLTDRAIPTRPQDKLPDNVVIVSAANTIEDTIEGTELSTALVTRFMTVCIENTPSNFKQYVMDTSDTQLADLKSKLEDRFEEFVTITVDKFARDWNKVGKYYGTNPRTCMNFYKLCNYYAQQNTLTAANVENASITTTATCVDRYAFSLGNTVVKEEKKESKRDISTMTLDEARTYLYTLTNSPKRSKNMMQEFEVRKHIAKLVKENSQDN